MKSIIFEDFTRPVNSLCGDFKAVSHRTWNLLMNAYENDFSISEETITDINLLELKMRQPHRLITNKLSRQNEGKIGADWIWGIVGRNGRTFLLYVQAKRLFPTMRYESLIHKEDPLKQVNTLLQNLFFLPMGIPLFPIYVFYNHFPHDPGIECNCGEFIPVQLAGCSYADAFDVRNAIAHGLNGFEDLYNHQYAWSCLVCCRGDNPKTDLATNFFNKIINPDRFRFITRNDDNIRDLNPDSFLLKEPPGFINQIIDGRLDFNPFEKLDVERIVVLKEE